MERLYSQSASDVLIETSRMALFANSIHSSYK
jgi:hypothetical protein